jgi:mitochondrial import inner membrane translocase subunit TIM50
MIDTEESHASANPENAIILPKWKGDPNDKDLIALIPFLEYTAAMGFDDTRKVLGSFKGKHIPTEFALREAEARKRFNEQLTEERKKRPRRSGIGALGSALGISTNPSASALSGQMSLSEGFEKGMMLHDQIRAQGQKQYEAFEKQIRDNEAEWMREIKREEEKWKEEQMKGMKQGFMGWFGGSGNKDEKK